MRYTLRFVGMFAGVFAMSVSGAQAQDRRINVSFGAGYTAPVSEVRDHLGDGYNITLGLQVNLTPTLAIEGSYGFNGLGSKLITLGVSPLPTPQPLALTDRNFFGDMNMQYGTAALVLQKPSGTARPYGVVGGGIYYRPIDVTTPGAGYVPGYCDPWWYICYPGGWVPVDVIVGERSSTDFGMVFGGGVNIKQIVFAEVRYHYIWGPKVAEKAPVQPIEPPPSITSDRKANGQFIAITFGVRY
jgi:Outer membrane protein beta-barrel domain